MEHQPEFPILIQTSNSSPCYVETFVHRFRVLTAPASALVGSLLAIPPVTGADPRLDNPEVSTIVEFLLDIFFLVKNKQSYRYGPWADSLFNIEQFKSSLRAFDKFLPGDDRGKVLDIVFTLSDTDSCTEDEIRWHIWGWSDDCSQPMANYASRYPAIFTAEKINNVTEYSLRPKGLEMCGHAMILDSMIKTMAQSNRV